MGVEGELVVRIETVKGRVTAARARADRLRVGPRLFVGRRAEEAASLSRSLFSVCGRSQSIAARSAVESIRGIDIPEAEIRARSLMTATEALQEHAWKVFVEGPRQLGEEPAIGALVEARRAVAAMLEATDAAALESAGDALQDWSRRALLGRSPEAFLELATLQELDAWMREAATPAAVLGARLLAQDPALGACDVAVLPRASREWVTACVAREIDARERFEDAPTLGGEAHETGPVARTRAHPLVSAAIDAWGRGVGARFVARLVEMAELLGELRAAAPLEGRVDRHGGASTGGGAGVGWAETARGLLVHRVALDGERIAAYRIVAPTEWNFHPEGAFTRGVRGLHGEPRAIEEGVRRVVASLDPCVAVRYEASHA